MSAIGLNGTRSAARKSGQGGAWHIPRASRLLHWTVAALVGSLVLLGTTIRVAPQGPFTDLLFVLHKTLGLAAFALILFRLAYRVVAMLRGRWGHKVGMHPVHLALYIGMVLVPLLGWAGVSDFGAREIAFGLSVPAILPEGRGWSEALFKAHGYLAFGLVALVVIHIGVALGDHVTRSADRHTDPSGRG